MILHSKSKIVHAYLQIPVLMEETLKNLKACISNTVTDGSRVYRYTNLLINTRTKTELNFFRSFQSITIFKLPLDKRDKIYLAIDSGSQ